MLIFRVPMLVFHMDVILKLLYPGGSDAPCIEYLSTFTIDIKEM